MVARVVAAAGAAAAAAAASLPPPAASLLALHLFEHGCGRLRTPCTERVHDCNCVLEYNTSMVWATTRRPGRGLGGSAGDQL